MTTYCTHRHWRFRLIAWQYFCTTCGVTVDGERVVAARLEVTPFNLRGLVL
ncbi:MAG TPA: hypothetical protein VMZ51_08085 [Acidimicrobiales bacterium]|nr:hypothetical protein [Acidimicrobiales bacterium]